VPGRAARPLLAALAGGQSPSTAWDPCRVHTRIAELAGESRRLAGRPRLCRPGA